MPPENQNPNIPIKPPALNPEPQNIPIPTPQAPTPIIPPTAAEIAQALKGDAVKNIEINKALEEFQTKEVQYEASSPVNNTKPEGSVLVRWVMKISGLEEEKQAEYLILGLVVLIFMISGFLFFGGPGKGSNDISPIIDVKPGLSPI